jgi:hypothetical protein
VTAKQVFSRMLTASSGVTIALVLGGCQATVKEDKIFLAENAEKQDLSLVRIQVKGYAENADMKFRAGFRNASAVDEVLKGETTPITIQGTEPDETALNNASSEIVTILAGKLKEAYQNRRPLEEIKQLEAELTRARSLARIVRAAETSQIGEAPAQKYIIAFSADPSKVFKAIADTTARGDAEGAVFKSLRLFREAEQARHTIESDTAKLTWQSLLVASKSGLSEDTTNDKTDAGYEAIRVQLLRYQTLLKDYLSASP